MANLFIIEDDPVMAECFALAADGHNTQLFSDAIAATAALADGLPDLIILDVLLNGPDGFTFLNELISYQDTARIPVILVSSLDLSQRDLSHYGVVAVFNKETMLPSSLRQTIFATLSQTQTQSEACHES